MASDNNRCRAVIGRDDDPGFDEMLHLFRRVYEADGIAMRSQKTENGVKMAIIFRPPANAAAEANLSQLKELLGLPPHANEFKVVHGQFALGNMEIAILNRSMLQIRTK